MKYILIFVLIPAIAMGADDVAGTASTPPTTAMPVNQSEPCPHGGVCCKSPFPNCRSEYFEINGRKGVWSAPYNFTTDTRVRLDTLIGDCHASSNLSDFISFTDIVIEKQLWKYDLAKVNIEVTDLDRGNTYIFPHLRILNPSKESDFVYLPIQLEHFESIQNFMPVEKLYKGKPIRKTELNVTLSCDLKEKGRKEAEDILYDVLTAHVNFIITLHTHYFLIKNGTITENQKLDSVCVSFTPDPKERPGVPFELTHCCSQQDQNLFEQEEHSGEDLDVTVFECHTPTGSVYKIRNWTFVFMVLLLLFLPLFVLCFPSRLEPYKVLRDTTRRGHRLYDRTENDRQICLADADYGEKIVEIEAEETEEDKLDTEDAVDTKEMDNGDITKEKKILRDNNDEAFEELPAIIEEGTHFRNKLPDRLYLDSDPEFHLNLHIVFSYLLLFQVDSHILMVLRRLVVLYLVWMLIGFGMFIYMTYYPVLLDDTMLEYADYKLVIPTYKWIMKDYGMVTTYRFFTYIVPAFAAMLTFLLLSPILLRKRTICETLHCNGDLRFFGDPFPETIVEMKELRRTPKPSKPWTYEDLIYRNMVARLKNLTKIQFWKLLWERWVCRGCSFKAQSKNTKKTTLDYALVVFWGPVCAVLVVLHVVPLFSVWANYIRKQTKMAFRCTDSPVSVFRRSVAIPLLLIQLFGIFVFYLMIWHLLTIVGQFAVFIFIDILRNATTTLSKIILFLAIVMYLRSAFQDFEDGYRELKSVTFTLCVKRAESNEDEGTNVVVKLKPHEPLYVKTKDGEASIPRRIFYDICKVYRPYAKEVISTFTRLFISFALMLVIFALIGKFQIFDEFSEMGAALLTTAIAILPSVLGMLKSAHHQGLRDQRRESRLRTWLEKITTTRKVNLNLNKLTKRVVSTC